MTDSFARALMTAGRCEPLEETDYRDTCRYRSDTNHAVQSLSLYLYRLRKNSIATKIVMMLHSKRASE